MKKISRVLCGVFLSVLGFASCSSPAGGGAGSGDPNSYIFKDFGTFEMSFSDNEWEIQIIYSEEEKKEAQEIGITVYGGVACKGTFEQDDDNIEFTCSEFYPEVFIFYFGSYAGNAVPFTFSGKFLENRNILCLLDDLCPLGGVSVSIGPMVKRSCKVGNLKDFACRLYEGEDKIKISNKSGDYEIEWSQEHYLNSVILGNKIYCMDGSINVAGNNGFTRTEGIFCFEFDEKRENCIIKTDYYDITKDILDYSVTKAEFDSTETKYYYKGISTLEVVEDLTKKGLIKIAKSSDQGAIDLVINNNQEWFTTTATEYEIPADVRVVQRNTFDGFPLEKITFAENSKVERIGTQAFMDTKITDITIPSGVKLISTGAFEDDYDLKSVKFEKTEGWKRVYSKKEWDDESREYVDVVKTEDFDVSNPEENARYLRNISYFWPSSVDYLTRE